VDTASGTRAVSVNAISLDRMPGADVVVSFTQPVSWVSRLLRDFRSKGV
jgi:hypothetical protein